MTKAQEAVYYLAVDKLEQANAIIRRNGGNIRYEVYENIDGTFDVRAGRMYKDSDGRSRFKYLYSVLCNLEAYSAYYCACGIEDAVHINYL